MTLDLVRKSFWQVNPQGLVFKSTFQLQPHTIHTLKQAP